MVVWFKLELIFVTDPGCLKKCNLPQKWSKSDSKMIISLCSVQFPETLCTHRMEYRKKLRTFLFCRYLYLQWDFGKIWILFPCFFKQVSSFHSEVVHKWRHAILNCFWLPPPPLSRFMLIVFIYCRHKIIDSSLKTVTSNKHMNHCCSCFDRWRRCLYREYLSFMKCQ